MLTSVHANHFNVTASVDAWQQTSPLHVFTTHNCLFKLLRWAADARLKFPAVDIVTWGCRRTEIVVCVFVVVMRWGVAAPLSLKGELSWLTWPRLCVSVRAGKCRRPSQGLGTFLTDGRNCCRTGLRWAARCPIITRPGQHMYNILTQSYPQFCHILYSIFWYHKFQILKVKHCGTTQQTCNLSTQIA